MKLMKSLGYILAATSMAFVTTAHAAVEPTAEKVEREIIVNATVDKAWEVVTDFGAIDQWHPAITKSSLETKKDEDGKTLPHRTLTLKDGGTMVQKQTKKIDRIKKFEYKIVEGGLPVSRYRAIIRVKPGANDNEAKIVYTGRFYNKAYSITPPAGEDNETAVKAVEAYYEAGLPELKAYIESK